MANQSDFCGLEIANHSFEVLYMSLHCGQDVDDVGRPKSPVQGGNIYLELDWVLMDMAEDYGEFLFKWVTSPNQTYDFKIYQHWRGSTSDTPNQTIEVRAGSCVSLVEKYSNGLTGQWEQVKSLQKYITCLMITAETIMIDIAELKPV
jgi:hypothetical protein